MQSCYNHYVHNLRKLFISHIYTVITLHNRIWHGSALGRLASQIQLACPGLAWSASQTRPAWLARLRWLAPGGPAWPGIWNPVFPWIRGRTPERSISCQSGTGGRLGRWDPHGADHMGFVGRESPGHHAATECNTAGRPQARATTCPSARRIGHTEI